MKSPQFPFKGEVKIFPLENPWIYVSMPLGYTEMFKGEADRGLVAVTVTIGKSTWNTSLMPMGDGTQFIPLNAKVRKNEGIEVGNQVEGYFELRER